MSSVRGGLWTAISRILAQVVQFAIFLVAVQVMPPAEFGIFALIWTWLLILSQFGIAGWQEYAMQWHGDDQRPRRVLALSMIFGALLTAVGFLAGYATPLITDDPRAVALMQLFSLWIFFASISGTFAGELHRRERLTSAAMATIVGDVASLIVSVWFLFQGHGVFALAYGRLAGVAFWAGAGWLLLRLIPDFRLTMPEVREILYFTWRIVAVRLMLNIRMHAATLVIGSFLGAAQAGYFRAAQRLISALAEVLGEPTRVLAWSLFRRTRNEQGGDFDFHDQANSFFPMLHVFATPVFLATALLAEDIALGLLGPEWLPAAPVIRILSISYLLLAHATAHEAVLSLAGAVRVLPYVVLGTALLGVAATLIAAPYGMLATSWAQVGTSAAIFVINAIVMQKYAKVRWLEVLWSMRMLPLAALVAWGALRLVAPLNMLDALHPFFRAFVLGIWVILVFGVAIFSLDAPTRQQVRRMLQARS